MPSTSVLKNTWTCAFFVMELFFSFMFSFFLSIGDIFNKLQFSKNCPFLCFQLYLHKVQSDFNHDFKAHDFKYSLSFLVLFVIVSLLIPSAPEVFGFIYVLLFPIGFVNLFLLVYFVFELHLEVFVF